MWRFSSTFSRGARSVRPSQCCTQDNADEAKNQNHPSTSPPPFSQDSACNDKEFHDSTKQIRKLPCPLAIANNCIHSLTWRWGCSNKVRNAQYPKFHYIWAIPCDVYPHVQAEWKDEYQREKWRRFYKRRKQLLLKTSILNAFGWGSAAALTWSLCQYIRSYHYIYNQNRIPLYSRLNTAEIKHNENLYFTNEENICDDLNISQKLSITDYFGTEDPSIQINHILSTTWKNASQNTSHRLWIHNPEINDVFSASSIDKITQQCSQFKEENSNRLESSSSPPCVLLDYPFSWHVSIERKPQVDVDRGILERHRRKESTDSGFLEENPKENHDSPNSELDYFSQTYKISNVLTDAFTNQSQECKTFETYVEDGGDLNSQNTHNVTSSKTSETLSFDTRGSEKDLYLQDDQNFHSKEQVFIEDCSLNEDIGDILSSKLQGAKTKTSTQKNSCIDEFSDGLQQIIDAGQKDLNDFSNQCLGILEGEIGRSLAPQDPAKAIPYFRAGALLGDAASTFNLALCYHMAQGIEQNLKLARKLYEAAALLDHGWATYNLAVLLSEGQGGPADSERALLLIEKAAKLGVAEAQVTLEQMKTSEEKIKCSSSGSEKKDKISSSKSKKIAQSEPSLTSIMSHLFNSSYSTSDLDFMEDSVEKQLEDISALRMEVSQKPTFYLG